MSIWKSYILTTFEVVGFLIIGFIVTDTVLRPTLEGYGIRYTGNVWVNWFGVSYLLFFLYTLIRGLFVKRHNTFFRHRIKSIAFWLFLIGSVYIIFIPFIKGENPF